MKKNNRKIAILTLNRDLDGFPAIAFFDFEINQSAKNGHPNNKPCVKKKKYKHNVLKNIYTQAFNSNRFRRKILWKTTIEIHLITAITVRKSTRNVLHNVISLRSETHNRTVAQPAAIFGFFRFGLRPPPVEWRFSRVIKSDLVAASRLAAKLRNGSVSLATERGHSRNRQHGRSTFSVAGFGC